MAQHWSGSVIPFKPGHPVPIRKERYGGYLSPWVDKMLFLFGEGKTFTEIAESINVAVRHSLGNNYYFVSDAMVRYVLQRIRAIPSPGKATPTPVVPPRKYIVQWTEPTTISWIRGRPIDMGGPRDVWIERDPWSDL
jgi:hypothetical protein